MSALPLSNIGRRYGRKTPPPLPKKMMLTRASDNLPPAVDLRPYCGPVKDQGQEGSCTAHAATEGGEWIYRRYFNKQPIFSPQYIYAKELIFDNNFPNDVGSDGNTLCNVVVQNGFCELTSYPYVAGDIRQPDADQDKDAAQWKIVGAYHGIQGSQVALSVLGDPTPWPIEMGFTVYASFESDEVASTGVVPLPQPGEQVVGGHEVLLVGHDISDNFMLRPVGCPPSVLVMNSWNTSWGINGFCWMPVEYLDMQDTDLKVFHAGGPWK